jgi:4'-phosphopantetheinyl transferase EntD
MPPLDAELTGLLRQITPPMVRAGARPITADDAERLTAREAEGFARAVAKVRRASGAARDIVRTLAGAGVEVLRDGGGLPIWPPDLMGAMTHDDGIAAALVVERGVCRGLGVDVEPNEPLESDLTALIASDAEWEEAPHRDIALRQLFSIKEAVFKAAFPVDGRMLDFQDVRVDFANGSAVTVYGRTLSWRSCRAARIFAVAWF